MEIGGRLTLLLFLAASLGACGGGGAGEGNGLGGSLSTDMALGVATDGNGNVYFAGRTNHALGGALAPGDFDLFVIKNGPTGVHQWTQLWGSGYDDAAEGVAIDNGGNVYVAGSTAYNPANPAAVSSNVLLVKYDSDGNGQWYRVFGAYGDGGAHAVAADNTGNVYVAGYTYGSVDGNPGAGGQDAFVIKVDGGGNVLWARQLGTPATDYATGVSVDFGGNVYVAGTTFDGLDGNAGAGGGDLFVAKFDGSGNKLWTRQLGSPVRDSAAGVCTDRNGNVIVTGYTDGSLDGNASAGSIDLFVVKYDTGGNKLWSRQMGTPSWDYANAVAADGAGNIYVGGQSWGGLDGNTYGGSWDLTLVKFDESGTRQWTRQFGAAADESANGVATDGTGNIYAVGGIMNPAGDLIVKYNSAGVRL